MKKKGREKGDEGKLGTILICDDSVDLRVFLGLKLERGWLQSSSNFKRKRMHSNPSARNFSQYPHP